MKQQNSLPTSTSAKTSTGETNNELAVQETQSQPKITSAPSKVENSSVSIVLGSSSPSNGRYFVPDSMTISEGTTVTWTNDDTTLHTVTSGTPEGDEASGIDFDSSYVGAGKTFQHTFANNGTFDYYCTLHPFMTGKVIVQ